MKNKIKRNLLPVINKIPVTIVLGLAFIFIISTMQSCKSNTATQQAAQTQHVDSIVAAKDTLQSQNNAIRLQVDDLTTKTAALDSQIMQKDAEIAKLTTKMKHIEHSNKLLARDLKKDKSLIVSLKAELADKSSSYAEKLGMLENDKNNLPTLLFIHEP